MELIVLLLILRNLGPSRFLLLYLLLSAFAASS
jgi:hypothetical protein